MPKACPATHRLASPFSEDSELQAPKRVWHLIPTDARKLSSTGCYYSVKFEPKFLIHAEDSVEGGLVTHTWV
jgi:hypothetical protein